ncbi:Major facilitator superfamily domain, general substrate transporter [Penicillium griseofulvum]|uniref:Major facilitator superfamily domain, general substrate transporter n=1 Tax=Penicillium patulum TaxID=5078 RepID=A0A135LA07_PENPA|nr:Major facilitator superfamily domain, general substrate transporter [Penicillium griseofulvum]KXG45791.1 Major facilitator superfamily domain, general substrate transporter [Penicillium griseofulvum]
MENLHAIDPKSTHEVSGYEFYSNQGPQDGLWLRFLTYTKWYPKDMSHPEKKLIIKLDVMILVFGCLSFFTKYLDQQAITNAYVSGMKEDLNLHGNGLNYITAIFWASYCTSMIPACYWLTRTRINIALPSLEIGWGLFTFGCAWANNLNTIYAMRFFIGICESCSFTGVIYVIGSWYKPGEVTRRVALFFVASPLGTMFAGYLQAAAYTNLEGRHGLPGWRWLFIICTIITIPICIVGYIVFPDVPHRSKPHFLTETEHDIANIRLKGLTAPSELKVSRAIFQRVFGRWHCLYLKAKPDIYSISRVNTLPTIATALSVVAALMAGVTADRLRNFWIPSVVTSIPVLVGVILLVVYNVGETGRLVGFIITGFEGAISPLTMSWATIIMAKDAEERAIVTASMNAIGQAMAAWTQIFQYPAISAPNFRTGFISNLVTTIAQFLSVGLIAFLVHRDARKEQKECSKV